MIEVVTPSGWRVYLKEELTYGEFLEVQKVMLSKVSVDPKTGEPANIGADLLQEANVKALSFLVQKVVDPSGNEQPPTASVMQLPARDGEMVMEKINSITSATSLPPKKGGK